MRYKNWKMYYTMSQPGAKGWIMPLIPFHFTLVQNIKRDPFEQTVGSDQKSAHGPGRRAGVADDRLHLRLEHAADRSAAVDEGASMSYKKYPPLQAPETYNLTQVIEEVKKGGSHPSD